jgi:hypothetical protein
MPMKRRWRSYIEGARRITANVRKPQQLDQPVNKDRDEERLAAHLPMAMPTISTARQSRIILRSTDGLTIWNSRPPSTP